MKFLLTIILGVVALTSGLRAQSELAKYSPAENVTHFSGKKFDPRRKCLLVKHYIIQGNVPFALRAAEKIADLNPEDGKALGTLSYVQLKSGLTGR